MKNIEVKLMFYCEYVAHKNQNGEKEKKAICCSQIVMITMKKRMRNENLFILSL